MNVFDIKHLREIEKLDCELTSIYNKNRSFKKLYEDSKNANLSDSKQFISSGALQSILADLNPDLIYYLSKMGGFDVNNFNCETGLIEIDNFMDLLNTVQYLIYIIQFTLTIAMFMD